MTGHNEQQLNCEHRATEKAKVGSWKGLRCLNCKALLNSDKTFVEIKVRP